MPVDPATPPELRVIVPKAELRARIDELAAELERDFSGRTPLLVVIAEGARRFGDALARGLEARGAAAPDVLVVRARRTKGTALGAVEVEDVDTTAFAERDVLIVDDIADEGRTIEAVSARVRDGKPQSLRVAVLVSKPARRRVELVLDYVGFEVPDGWIVGFGMDLDEAYRDLDHLAIVEPG